MQKRIFNNKGKMMDCCSDNHKKDAISHARHLHHDHSHHISTFKNRFWVSLALTIPIVLLSEMIQMWFKFRIEFVGRQWLLLILSGVVYFYGGMPFIKGAFDEIKVRRPGMMTLIGTAITIAFFYSAATVIIIKGQNFFWELATLIDVMLLGHWIEAKSVLAASKAVEELVKIMPTVAHLIENDKILDVSVSQLKVGDKVLVRPGEKIPADGVVIDGESFTNEALLTGESKPVHKRLGDKVIGGAINGEGSLTVKVEKAGEETYIAQVIKLVQQAQESKSKTQDLANKAAALLFYVALVAGITTYLVWFILKNPDFALERAVTVLVIACPHALGLAIPLVVAISTSITAKNGILVRNRRTFETLKDVKAIVFDKTGTLTEGSFGITDVISFIDESKLLKLASGVEINSEHIIAKAIVEYAKQKGVVDIPSSKDFKAIAGKGVYAKVLGEEVFVGSESLLEDMKIEVANTQRIKTLQKQGKTVVFVVVNGELAGFFAFSDKIRRESYEAVKTLKNLGIKIFMLTGDSKDVADWVAKELGVDSYFAQVLPHEKADKVNLLRKEGYKVAMVGDGINDAPALASADVGIAIGAGTDVAVESADIILVKNNPLDVVKAIEISKRTYSKMLQNLWWAAGYNILAIPLAAGILYTIGILLPPAIGAVVMSISTIIVALNSQTLRRYEPKGGQIMEKKHITKDPVCGMDVTPETAASKIEYKGDLIYFCSTQCAEKFSKSPEKFLAKNKRSKEDIAHEHQHH